MITTGNTEHMDLDEAKKALALAPAGTTIIYARGTLDYDCGQKTDNRLPLLELRKFIYAAYKDGKVQLFQRRIGENQYEYQARKRHLNGKESGSVRKSRTRAKAEAQSDATHKTVEQTGDSLGPKIHELIE